MSSFIPPSAAATISVPPSASSSSAVVFLPSFVGDRFSAKSRPRSSLLTPSVRREVALQRQHHSREARAQALRDIIQASHEEEEHEQGQRGSAESTSSTANAIAAESTDAMSDAVVTPSSGVRGRQEPKWHRSMRVDYASRLMMPCWMEALPNDAIDKVTKRYSMLTWSTRCDVRC